MHRGRDSQVDAIVDVLRDGTVVWEDPNWFHHPDVIEAHQQLADEALAQAGPDPGSTHRRGILTIAGGARYFANAYVMVRMLRERGCNLPVQFWHFSGEIDDPMRELVEPWGVECVSVDAVLQENARGKRPAGHWEMKAFALANSCFRETLYVDADVVFVRDPTELFEAADYREVGVALWPDYTAFPANHPAWEIFQVEYRDEPECQGGLFLYDKPRAWPAIALCLFYNEHSDFYYRYIYGDKDTFRMACYRADQPFVMPFRREHLPGTICHVDFQDRRLSQHRYGYKWRLHEPNPSIDGFWLEDACLRVLRELEEAWHGEPFLPG